ncbi:MAG: DUF1186 domain-containing protein [Hyphomicrobiales bacterium]|nr:DUF1186 domain-containing protein [Hyphomicrobiales bacterium]
MDVQEILEKFSNYDGLPVEAIRAAEADRAAMVPVFLQVIQTFISASSEERAYPSPIFFIFHLLASWREKSAYQPMVRLLRCPRDDLENILGDAITETSARVIAAVFDGDPQHLYETILDTRTDEFVRSAMCDTLAIVTLRGQLPRPEAARFLASCFTDIKPELDCYVWDGWQDAIAALGLTELRPLVKQAFERGSVEPTWLSFEDFEEDLKAAVDYPEAPLWFVERFPPLDDVVEEFSSWPSFKEGERERERIAAGAHRSLWDGFHDGPAVNPFKEVGRNDPCPCGSGKKFKKCCLDSHREAPFQGEAA